MAISINQFICKSRLPVRQQSIELAAQFNFRENNLQRLQVINADNKHIYEQKVIFVAYVAISKH